MCTPQHVQELGVHRAGRLTGLEMAELWLTIDRRADLPLPVRLLLVREELDLANFRLTLWKSGLAPFMVLAMSVNCDTQRISPSMSLTLRFHIAPVEGSSNTFRETLLKEHESFGIS